MLVIKIVNIFLISVWLEENKLCEKVRVIFLCVFPKPTRKCKFSCVFGYFRSKTDKEMLISLCVRLFPCVLFQNRQGNANFLVCSYYPVCCSKTEFPYLCLKKHSGKLDKHRKKSVSSSECFLAMVILF
jgi:hypothetical protein